MKTPVFKPGQEWGYRTRANEAKSTFVILKIDRDVKFGNIIHIAISELKMKNQRSPDGISDRIAHMPFSEKALGLSAVKLLREDVDLPSFQDGYKLWKEAFDQGQAGFYTVSVAQAVTATEETLNQ